MLVSVENPGCQLVKAIDYFDSLGSKEGKRIDMQKSTRPNVKS